MLERPLVAVRLDLWLAVLRCFQSRIGRMPGSFWRIPDFTAKDPAQARNTQAFDGHDAAMKIALPGRQQIGPVLAAIGIVVTVDKPNVDTGIEQRRNFRLEWLLRFDVPQENNGLRLSVCWHVTLERWQDVIEIAVNVAKEIDHELDLQHKPGIEAISHGFAAELVAVASTIRHHAHAMLNVVDAFVNMAV